MNRREIDNAYLAKLDALTERIKDLEKVIINLLETVKEDIDGRKTKGKKDKN